MYTQYYFDRFIIYKIINSFWQRGDQSHSCSCNRNPSSCLPFYIVGIIVTFSIPNKQTAFIHENISHFHSYLNTCFIQVWFYQSTIKVFSVLR